MKALLVVAQSGYQDVEYNAPKRILENAGIITTTASKNQGECIGKLGGTTQAEVSFRQVRVDEYDAVLFIGGPGVVGYQQDREAHRIAQEAVQWDKILAAICIAPTILAYAGVLKGKKATVWNGDGRQGTLLQAKGATYTGEEVTVDGRLVTANGPAAAEKFGRKVVKLLL